MSGYLSPVVGRLPEEVADHVVGETYRNGVRIVWVYGQTEGGYPVGSDGRILPHTPETPHMVQMFNPFFRDCDHTLYDRDLRLEEWIKDGRRGDALQELQESWEYHERRQKQEQGNGIKDDR
jgi:hypothetical protein